jgi:hypothetical protein
MMRVASEKLLVTLVLGITICCLGRDAVAQGDLSSQAENICKTMFSRLWTQHDSNWFIGHKRGGGSGGFAPVLGAAPPSVTVAEAHGITINMLPKKLGTADNLNGVDWDGGAIFFADALRFRQHGAWTPWQGKQVVFQCFLTHKQGRWSGNGADNLMYLGTTVPVDPSTLPQ